MIREGICKHPKCGRSGIKARGYCNAHYVRLTRGKDMDEPVRTVAPTDAERFWEKVDKTSTCWEWTGARQNGYGVCRFQSTSRLAHRVAYTLIRGQIPAGVQLDHKCHNRGCVNPSHLRFADHKLNGQNRSGANKNSRSGVRGVYWDESRNAWQAGITIDRKVIRLGLFTTKEEASRAIKTARRELMPYSLMDQRKGS